MFQRRAAPIVVTLAILSSNSVVQAQTGVIHEVTEASSAFDWLGYTMDAAGDVDGDGWEDVFVGIPRYNPSGLQYPNGALAVYSGFDGSRLSLVVGPTFGSLGYAMRSAGDIDQDGVIDSIASGWPAETVWVHSTKGGSLLWEFKGNQPGELFGWSVDVAGDVDADGMLDFVVGSPGYDIPNGLSHVGAARAISGATGADLHSHLGVTSIARMGMSVAGVGDVDQDGHDDYAIGITGHPVGGTFGFGAIEVHSGNSGAKLHVYTGDAAGEKLGSLVRRVGDIDGDGFQDFLLGGFGANNAIHDQIRIQSGADGSLILKMKKKLPEARIWTAAPFGDWDGDSKDEVLVTFEESLSQEPTGVLTVAIVNSTGVTLASHSGPFDERFGNGCSMIGDVNGNGLDFAIGSYLAPGSGKLSILSSTLGTITEVGTACNGSFGIDAFIGLGGTPTPGGSFELTALSGTFAPTVAAMFLGASGASIPAGNGCSLYVGSPYVVTFLATDQIGKIEFETDTPVNFPLGPVHVQVLFADALSPVGFTATEGRIVDFQ